MSDRDAFRKNVEEYLNIGRVNWGQFADQLGYTREHVSRILHGKTKMPEDFVHSTVRALAELECIRGKAQARKLLRLMDALDFTLDDWRIKPLAMLDDTDSSDSTVGKPFPVVTPAVWNIPHPRNPFFTGREPLLQQLADTWKRDQSTAYTPPQVISGLGGIGKTQIVVEYAYLHRHEY